MKFDKFDFYVDKHDIYILPTVRISKQIELIEFFNNNFNIQFHFAIFHFRWRWLKRWEE